MNKLEELIKEHCPDGVEYKKLSKVASVERGKRVVREQLPKEGKYLVFQNSLTPLGFYNQCNYKANTTYVIGAGAAGDIGYSKNDFWAADDCFPIVCSSALNDRYALHQRAYRIHPLSDVIIGKYLYYYFVAKFPSYISQQMFHGSVPSIRRPMLNKFEVMVPSIEEQERIVSILDRFDTLCNNLTSGLPAEIEARQKQYEYYRDRLLSFKEN